MKNLVAGLAMLAAVMLLGFIPARQDTNKALSLLKTSREKFLGLKDLSASFTYTLANKGTETVKKGTLYVKGQSYRVDLGDQEILGNSKKMWMVLKEEKEITESSVEEGSGFHPAAFFKLYEKDAVVSMGKEEVLKGVSYHRINISSKSKSQDYTKAEISINSKTSLAEKVVLYAKNGSVVKYTLTAPRINQGLKDQLFALDPAGFPGFEIVSLD